MKWILHLFAGLGYLSLCLNAHAEILVGVAAPVTGSYAWNGEQVVQGATVAIEDINSEGGVLGESLKAVVVDDFCDGDQAIAAAKKLIESAVQVVVGHQCSGAMIPASELYEAAGIVVISPAATNPVITDRGLDLVFRTGGRDDHQSELIADYLAELPGNKKIAIVHDDQAYGRGVAEEVIASLSKRSIAIGLSEEIELGQKDFADLVDQFSAAEIDLVFYGGYPHEAGLLVRQTSAQLPHIEFVVSDGVDGDDFPLIAGEAANGVRMTTLVDARRGAEAQAAVARFSEVGYDPVAATLYTYAAIQAWAEAATITGSTDSKAVSSTLRSETFDTVLGRLGFDKKGDVTGIDSFDWYLWTDGAYAPLEEAELTD